jgi:hypothetical protein
VNSNAHPIPFSAHFSLQKKITNQRIDELFLDCSKVHRYPRIYLYGRAQAQSNICSETNVSKEQALWNGMPHFQSVTVEGKNGSTTSSVSYQKAVWENKPTT